MRHSLNSYLDGRSRVEFCTQCGCEQGEMPTECPAYAVSQRDKQLIAQGEKDYVNGQWRLLTQPNEAAK